jgi:hypothetical protein
MFRGEMDTEFAMSRGGRGLLLRVVAVEGLKKWADIKTGDTLVAGKEAKVPE